MSFFFKSFSTTMTGEYTPFSDTKNLFVSFINTQMKHVFQSGEEKTNVTAVLTKAPLISHYKVCLILIHTAWIASFVDIMRHIQHVVKCLQFSRVQNFVKMS